MSAAPARPWLAVIDMQKVFAAPDSDWAAPRFADILGPVEQLVAAFRGRTTFTRFVAPAAPAGAWREYYARWPFALRPPDAELYGIVDALAPQAREAGPTLDAETFGKWTPWLAERVGAGGELVLAGVSTDCCVLSTALAAADAGVKVHVVADACTGASEDSHTKTLEILRLYGPLVEVVDLAGALARWAPGKTPR